ncbi:MAG: polysaccharide biosynthesis protein PelF [Solirubrobacteraceae bacterium]|nr:polysaccharide biosynthesis protein PelF [Solirubrobacteraceae bacterium]
MWSSRSPDTVARRRLRVLMITEGTYPYAMGGVSSWCDYLVRGLPEIDWEVLPIVGAGLANNSGMEVPANVKVKKPVELWSEGLPGWRWRRHGEPGLRLDLPYVLVRGLLCWNGDRDELTQALVWCQRRPHRVRNVFRNRGGWEMFLEGLREVCDERTDDAGQAPELDTYEAATLYQILYWVARAAAERVPRTDILHVTAAGWAGIPATVQKALYGTPVVLTEHGVYLRESYLAAVRSPASPGERFISTRLARGLARSAYDAADVISPVTDANASWEIGLGVDVAKIHVIRNGVDKPPEPTQAPNNHTVVAVGRVDPLKDVHTMLRVAAEVIARMPEATFRYFGPVTQGEEAYGRSCHDLHARLGLGDRFEFMGPTQDPNGVIRDADLVLMTSISEGLPMALLEAMSQARPVVSTGVGGVPEVVRGCGMVTAPGDTHALAQSVLTLLRNPRLASELGMRGHARVQRTFARSASLTGYRELFERVASTAQAEAA